MGYIEEGMNSEEFSLLYENRSCGDILPSVMARPDTQLAGQGPKDFGEVSLNKNEMSASVEIISNRGLENETAEYLKVYYQKVLGGLKPEYIEIVDAEERTTSYELTYASCGMLERAVYRYQGMGEDIYAGMMSMVNREVTYMFFDAPQGASRLEHRYILVYDDELDEKVANTTDILFRHSNDQLLGRTTLGLELNMLEVIELKKIEPSFEEIKVEIDGEIYVVHYTDAKNQADAVRLLNVGNSRFGLN
jgi:hypothetical protein